MTTSLNSITYYTLFSFFDYLYFFAFSVLLFYSKQIFQPKTMNKKAFYTNLAIAKFLFLLLCIEKYLLVYFLSFFYWRYYLDVFFILLIRFYRPLTDIKTWYSVMLIKSLSPIQTNTIILIFHVESKNSSNSSNIKKKCCTLLFQSTRNMIIESIRTEIT